MNAMMTKTELHQTSSDRLCSLDNELRNDVSVVGKTRKFIDDNLDSISKTGLICPVEHSIHGEFHNHHSHSLEQSIYGNLQYYRPEENEEGSGHGKQQDQSDAVDINKQSSHGILEQSINRNFHIQKESVYRNLQRHHCYPERCRHGDNNHHADCHGKLHCHHHHPLGINDHSSYGDLHCDRCENQPISGKYDDRLFVQCSSPIDSSALQHNNNNKDKDQEMKMQQTASYGHHFALDSFSSSSRLSLPSRSTSSSPILTKMTTVPDKKMKMKNKKVLLLLLWPLKKCRDGFMKCLLRLDGMGDLTSLAYGGSFVTSAKHFADPQMSRIEYIKYS